MNDLAIIILNWNGTEDTIECLESLNTSAEYDVYVLDNGSEEPQKNALIDYCRSSKWADIFCVKEDADSMHACEKRLVVYTSNENLGFAKGNNYLAQRLAPFYKEILLLNNDTVVPDNTIMSMHEKLKMSGCVAVTCDIRYFYDPECLWNAGGKFTFYGDRKYYSQKSIDRLEEKGKKFIYADFITGCALMIDSNYIIQHGLFTDKFFHGEEDFNFCLLAKKRGEKLGVDLESRLYHKVGKSIGAADSSEKTIKATIVHYSNRIIDYKEFYSAPKWLLWREFYLGLASIKRISSGMSPTAVSGMIKKIRKITTEYDSVDKQLFDSIMGRK